MSRLPLAKPPHEIDRIDTHGDPVEVQARFTPDELSQMPADEQPVFLVPKPAQV